MKTLVTILLALSLYGHEPRNDKPCAQNCGCNKQHWNECSVYCFQMYKSDGTPRCMTQEEMNGCYRLCLNKGPAKHEGGK